MTIGMTAAFSCPDCDGRLADAGAANAWQCKRCGTWTVEQTTDSRQRVEAFYQRASDTWEGMLG
jgi:tRNA(Ile2) C34 agmatinyltransferase TiaS